MPRRTVELAALCVVFLALFGCGADLDIDLPNKHQLLVLNSRDVTISSPSGQAIKYSVGELNDAGGHVFGTIIDPDTQVFEEYFVLDTKKSEAVYFVDETEWRSFLSQLGITDTKLRRPTAFYNIADAIWWRVLALVGVLILLALPIQKYFSGQKQQRTVK